MDRAARGDSSPRTILETPHTEVVSNGIRADVSAADRINQEYDAFVIPLANAFRPLFEARLRRLTRLVGKLRLPWPRWGSARGPGSATTRRGEVIGCPSLFLYGKELTVTERPALGAGSRIAVNGSHSAVRWQGLDRVITRAHARYPYLRFIGGDRALR